LAKCFEPSHVQQTPKPSLLKIMIARKGFGNAPLLHHEEARAIDQSPRFILMAAEVLKRPPEKRFIHDN
jgi:hypothetical protein